MVAAREQICHAPGLQFCVVQYSDVLKKHLKHYCINGNEWISKRDWKTQESTIGNLQKYH